MKPLKIFTIMPPHYGGCAYYRISVPVRAMHLLGLPIETFIDRPEDASTHEDRMQRFFACDVAYIYQPTGGNITNYLDLLEDFRPRRNGSGEWQWPPSVVIDTDDDLFKVELLNPAFTALGVEFNGKPVQPRSTLIHHKANGEASKTMREGQDFVLADNLHRLAEFRGMLHRADMVTTTTPYAAEYIRRETVVKDLHIAPNAVLFEDFPDYGGVSIQRKNPNEIRILWQGGDSHYEDLLEVKDAIVQLAHKHNNVKWVFWGALYDWLISDLPSDRVEWHRWVDHRAYHLKLGTMDCDISIAPLARTAFNRSRSAIKWYEASSVKSPMAMVAAKYGPYELEIQDGKNGLLYETPQEFVSRIEELIGSETRRRELAANAKQWVFENRNARLIARQLYDKFVEVRARKRDEMPPTPEDEKPREEGKDAAGPEHQDLQHSQV